MSEPRLMNALDRVNAAEFDARGCERFLGTASTITYVPQDVYDRLVSAYANLRALREQLQWEYL